MPPRSSSLLPYCSFDLFDKEARRLLAKRLPIPAYDHLLKCSHTFNILDARGQWGAGGTKGVAAAAVAAAAVNEHAAYEHAA